MHDQHERKEERSCGGHLGTVLYDYMMYCPHEYAPVLGLHILTRDLSAIWESLALLACRPAAIEHLTIRHRQVQVACRHVRAAAGTQLGAGGYHFAQGRVLTRYS